MSLNACLNNRYQIHFWSPVGSFFIFLLLFFCVPVPLWVQVHEVLAFLTPSRSLWDLYHGNS